jgi:pheromone shutdown protein TraB
MSDVRDRSNERLKPIDTLVWRMITLIGVGHVFKIADQVKGVILGEMPGAVCVELDPGRYYALCHPEMQRQGPLTYRLLSLFQRRLAKNFGGELGSEMLAAVEAANLLGVESLMIDMDAKTMFDRVWREMPVKERLKLFFSAIIGMIASKKSVETELESFSENEEAYLNEFGNQFPTLKRVLIDDRNQLMSARIIEAEARFGNVVAVVGEGHIDGIRRLLGDRTVQLVRLKELQNGEAGKRYTASNDGKEVTFTYQYQ